MYVNKLTVQSVPVDKHCSRKVPSIIRLYFVDVNIKKLSEVWIRVGTRSTF